VETGRSGPTTDRREMIAALLAFALLAPADSTPIRDPALASEAADRIGVVAELGLWMQPYAPEGLSDCDEMTFYRVQWGLPERFDRLGWRESNCRNEDVVRTFCCHGYWQLYVSLHLRDHRLVDRYHECGVYSLEDVNSDVPIEKQRQACAAAVLFDVIGYSAWSTG
jgi:hypothetical protein